MSKNKIKIGLLAENKDAELHYLAYKENKFSEVCGFYLNDKEFTKPSEKIPCFRKDSCCMKYDNYQDLINDPEIDAIEIVASPASSYKFAIESLKAHKNIAMESPFAQDLESADKIIETSKANNCKLYIYTPSLFYPPYCEAKRLIDEGKIGEVQAIRIKSVIHSPSVGSKQYAVGNDIETVKGRHGDTENGNQLSVISNQSSVNSKPLTVNQNNYQSPITNNKRGQILFKEIYDKLFLAYFFMGEIEKIYAMGIESNGTFAPAIIMWKYKEPCRYGILEIVFSKDMFIESKHYPQDEGIEVTGTSGYIWVTNKIANMQNTPSLLLYRRDKLHTYEDLQDDWLDAFINCSAHFIDYVRGKKHAFPSIIDAQKVLKWALTAKESSVEGKEVLLS